jgi:hypothetical protein
MALRHDSAARRNPALTRPADHAIEAAARGKVIPALCTMSRPGLAPRTTSGARGWQRHGHVAHTRKVS